MHSIQNEQNFNKYLIDLWKSYSGASEQYQKLRTYILTIARNNANRVFLLSSAVNREGKTLTAINLALAIVKGINETVLVDADLRKPNVSDMLGFEKYKKGLAEYLTSGIDLANFITKTSIPKLSVITSGLPPENPSELIHSKYMSDLIKEVKHRYDNRFIIIDSPPLIPVTDSTILSSLADGIIIVIKASTTPKKLVYEAINNGYGKSVISKYV